MHYLERMGPGACSTVDRALPHPGHFQHEWHHPAGG